MKVSKDLLRFISKDSPVESRLGAARGEGSGFDDLSPARRATVFFVLSFDPDARVAEAAKKSLESMGVEEAADALHDRLDPLVIRRLVSIHSSDPALLAAAALNRNAGEDTLVWIAEHGGADVAAIFLEDASRAQEHPALVEALGRNPGINAERVEGLKQRLGPGETDDSVDRGAGEADGLDPALVDEVDPDSQNMYQLVQGLNIAQKIKLALTGNKAAREILVKDSNKVIALSALKNPRITEEEVRRLTASKSTPEELMRAIGRNREWVKDYSIKLGMVTNAKTPLTLSLKYLDHLYVKDLEKLAKSKNIPSVLSSSARRKLEMKKKH